MDDLLSREEQARRDRFAFAEDRRAFVAAHALLRTALSRYGGRPARDWRFETTSHGKPFLLAPPTGGPSLAFNLSHTRTAVACAVGVGADIGVDIEECGSRVDVRRAQRYFTAAEQRMLAECPPEEVDARFVELWVLKEAYAKALGAGLTLPLDSFGFGFAFDAASAQGTGGLTFDRSGWQLWLAAPYPNTRIAIASPAPPSRRISWWDARGQPARGVTLLRVSAG
jgi:4'-phosphopantetheinyl transferase